MRRVWWQIRGDLLLPLLLQKKEKEKEKEKKEEEE